MAGITFIGTSRLDGTGPAIISTDDDYATATAPGYTDVTTLANNGVVIADHAAIFLQFLNAGNMTLVAPVIVDDVLVLSPV